MIDVYARSPEIFEAELAYRRSLYGRKRSTRVRRRGDRTERSS